MTRSPLPNRRNGLSFGFTRNKVNFIGSVGLYPDGRPGEVFVSCDKTTTEIEALGRDAAILISLGLQHGATLETMRHAVTRNEKNEGASFIGMLLDELEQLLGPDGGDAPCPAPAPAPPKPVMPANGEYVGLSLGAE